MIDGAGLWISTKSLNPQKGKHATVFYVYPYRFTRKVKVKVKVPGFNDTI